MAGLGAWVRILEGRYIFAVTDVAALLKEGIQLSSFQKEKNSPKMAEVVKKAEIFNVDAGAWFWLPFGCMPFGISLPHQEGKCSSLMVVHMPCPTLPRDISKSTGEEVEHFLKLMLVANERSSPWKELKKTMEKFMETWWLA